MFHRLILAAIAAVCLFAAAPEPANASPSGVIATMRADLGTNPTGWKNRWCAVYLRNVLLKHGYKEAYRKTDNRAISFKNLTRTPLKVGAIAVMRSHTCVVTAVLPSAFRCIGGNQGAKHRDGRRRVSENVYPRSRLVAVVRP